MKTSLFSPRHLSTPQTIAPPSSAISGVGRFDYIDGLRAVACLMVIFCHAANIMPIDLNVRRLPEMPIFYLRYICGQGYSGVNLFLLLSGFCLYWPFVKPRPSPDPTLLQFAKRRCRRILPPYYVVCVVGTLLRLDTHTNSLVFPAKALIVHLALLQTAIPGYFRAIWGHLWSIPLEFDCYLLFPVLVELYRRFPPRRVLAAALATNALYRLVVVHSLPGLNFETGFELIYILVNNVFGRFFEFALGMFCARLIADWNRTGQSPLRPVDFAAVALGIFVVCLLVTAKDPTGLRLSPFGDIAYGLSFAGLLLLASRPHLFLHSWLTNPWLVRLGVISYSVYLVHLGVLIEMQYQWVTRVARHLGNPTSVSLHLMYSYLIAIPLTIAVGYGFHLVVERPFLSHHAQREIAVELREHPTTPALGANHAPL